MAPGIPPRSRASVARPCFCRGRVQRGDELLEHRQADPGRPGLLPRGLQGHHHLRAEPWPVRILPILAGEGAGGGRSDSTPVAPAHRRLRIFSGTSNPSLSQEVAHYLGLELGGIKIKRFADGEVYVQIQESIRGCDVFLVQPTCPPANDHLMELLIMIDACKRASARSITAVIPYFGYARADRKTQGRESIAAKLTANIITEAGADRVLCVDLHSGQCVGACWLRAGRAEQWRRARVVRTTFCHRRSSSCGAGYFDIPVDHVYGMTVILDYLASKRIQTGELVVVSPDVGGVARARAFAKKLNDAPLAIVDKRRSAHNVSEVMNLIGDVRGKIAVLVDDMIDTAGTITNAAKARRAPRSRGANSGCLLPPWATGGLQR